MQSPCIFGVVNITEDSFSDGGRYLDPTAAVTHARTLAASGADVIDLGAAASNVDAKRVSPAEEVRRLDPVISALAGTGVLISVDSFTPEAQRFAIEQDVAFLNDILGFPDVSVYPELAAADCRLVVMHAVQARGPAQRVELSADQAWDRMTRFFSERLAALERGGIARERLILDPGMGFFLSTRPEASLRVLVGIRQLKREFGLPVMVSVSRKSFLRALTGRTATSETGAATLAAELYAVAAGADFIRTHDPAALRDGLKVISALRAAESDLLTPLTYCAGGGGRGAR